MLRYVKPLSPPPPPPPPCLLLPPLPPPPPPPPLIVIVVVVIVIIIIIIKKQSCILPLFNQSPDSFCNVWSLFVVEVGLYFILGLCVCLFISIRQIHLVAWWWLKFCLIPFKPWFVLDCQDICVVFWGVCDLTYLQHWRLRFWWNGMPCCLMCRYQCFGEEVATFMFLYP